MFFSLSALNISYHFFLACQVSVDRSDIILMFLPLYVRNLFPLATFKIDSLDLRFANCFITCYGVGLFSLILRGVLSASWTRKLVSFARLGKFSATNCSNISPRPLFFSTPSGMPIILPLVCFIESVIYRNLHS